MRPNPTLGFVLVLAGCAFPLRVDHLTEQRDFTQAITAIDLYTPTGDIRVEGTKETTSHLTVDYAWHGTQPALDAHVDADGTLVVAIDCHNPSWYCQVDLTLEVPDTVDVKAQTHTGDVTVGAIEGSADVETTTGNLLLTGLAGNVTATSSTGTIVGRQIDSDLFVAQASTGDIDIVHNGGFTRLDAETSTGDVDLLVPSGTYDVTTETSTGQVEVKAIVDNPAADASIRGVTSTGDVRITGYTVAP